MKFSLSILCCFLFLFTLSAQEIERIEIEGKIIVEVEDIEGVTVYNTSSNKGTITDTEGKFKIKVALNDKIEVSALQFQDFEVKISQEVLDSKQITVYLVEQVNKLDEVVILPYGLTGTLSEDIASVEVFNPDLDAIYFGVNDITAYEFSDDYHSGVDNIAIGNQNDRIRYQLNGMAILEGLFSLLKSKNKTKKTEEGISNEEEVEIDLTDKFGQDYFVKNYNIPESKVQEFILYLENKGLEPSLLEDKNEINLTDYLVKESKQFLSTISEKE